MKNPFDDQIIDRGRARPIDRRTVYARALLDVMERPGGIETLDWQLADAAITMADIEHCDMERRLKRLERIVEHICPDQSNDV